MEVTNLTKDDFIARVGNFEADPKDWEYIGDKPCLVDFHAPWCGYCKRLNPLLDEMAQEFDGKIYIYKVDVVIETKEGSFQKRIIGRTNDYLITMDNEKIAIDDIIDIYTK